MSTRAADAAYQARILDLEQRLAIAQSQIEEMQRHNNQAQEVDINIHDGNHGDEDSEEVVTVSDANPNPRVGNNSFPVANVGTGNSEDQETVNETRSIDESRKYTTVKIPEFIPYEETTITDLVTFKIHAKQWIRKVEDIFILKNTPDKDKSILASVSLKGSAFSWYVNAAEKCAQEKKPYLLWEDFKKLFFQYAVPGNAQMSIFQDMKALQLKMTKGMKVFQYAKAFWNIKDGMEAESDQMAKARFINGLTSKIKTSVLQKKPDSLADAINDAYTAELEVVNNLNSSIKLSFDDDDNNNIFQ